MDRLGEKLCVFCYSNLEEIELFVNGKSYGKKKMEPNWYLSWEGVVYEPGELRAVGYRNGRAEMTEVVRTTGAPYRIELTPYRSHIGAGETTVINVRITDANGLTVPTANQEIIFQVEGGTLLGTGNGNPGSHENEKLPVRRAFHGLCQLLVRASGENNIRICAAAADLREGTCEVRASSVRQ